jgi:hypothetical protein
VFTEQKVSAEDLRDTVADAANAKLDERTEEVRKTKAKGEGAPPGIYQTRAWA